MKIDRLSVNNLGYNPEEEAFEALVVLNEAGENYAYPVQLRAPLTAEFDFVARKLAEKARQLHRHAPSREMRLRRAPVPAISGGAARASLRTAAPHRPSRSLSTGTASPGAGLTPLPRPDSKGAIPSLKERAPCQTTA
jgi:hypothetical protein